MIIVLYSLVFLTVFDRAFPLAYKPNNAYSESILKPVRSFGDVAIFHYSVPAQSSQAIWTFLAFMDNPNCAVRRVNIHLRFGSYPVISIDNSPFPNNTLLPEDLGEYQYSITTHTHFQPKEMPQIDIINPLPGSWFAIAYIVGDENEAIQQEGISHICHYSLGSMASWNQELDVRLLIPSVATNIHTFSDINWLKVYVPENTWELNIIVSNCTINATNDPSQHDICDCIYSIHVDADALPDITLSLNQTQFNCTNDHIKKSSDFEDYIFNVSQPQTNVYYYIGIRTQLLSSFTIKVELKECESIHLNSDWFPSPITFDRDFPSKSLNLKPQHRYTLIDSNELNKSRDIHCVPSLTLMRIKHAQDFLDSFLFQGSDWFSSRIAIQDSSIIFIRFEILPFIDIGGTMITKFLIDPSTVSDTFEVERMVIIEICLTPKRAPKFNDKEIQCPSKKQHMYLRTNHSKIEEAIKFVPFPSSGSWFIAIRAQCYNDTASNLTVPCEKDEIRVDLRIRLQPCILEGDQCGGHGICRESHFRQFYYSSCHCSDGWKGWGCTDGSVAIPSSLMFIETLLLVLSNLFFIPAIYISIQRKFYAESVVYMATLFFSSSYHACDTEILNYCIFKYEVLQFCDFYSAILAFWVTVVAIACLPMPVCSCAHMAGALGIALAVQSEKTGIFTFVIPVVSGLAIMILSWGSKCLNSKTFKLSSKLLNLIPGVILVAIGFVLFVFLETEANYKYVHSAWHVTIALSITLLLPRNQNHETENTIKSVPVNETIETIETVSDINTEIIDIGEYRLNSDLISLVGVN